MERPDRGRDKVFLGTAAGAGKTFAMLEEGHEARRAGRSGESAGSLLCEAREFWRLPDDELVRLLALAREADRLHLKLVVPEPVRDATCAALGVDLACARARRVYFLDTPDLALHRHGVWWYVSAASNASRMTP